MINKLILNFDFIYKEINMIKIYIFLYILLCSVYSQNIVNIKEYRIFKNNNDKQINIFELINEQEGYYKVELFALEDLNYERYKTTLNPFTCELEFNLSSSLNSDDLKIKICDSKMKIKDYLFVDKQNPYIYIEHEKFTTFEATFIFLITGIYSDDIENRNFDQGNHGFLREWYDDGNIYLEFQMNNGIKNGLCKKWYNNGQIQMIYNYKKGRLHGNQKRWYENGQLKSELNYLSDKQDGISKEWYEDGKIKTIKKFINGSLVETLEHN